MKKIYLIIYALNNISKDYSIFKNNLKLLGDWRQDLPFSWFIKSTLTANEISEKLLSFLDVDKDFLFVAEIKKDNKQGWLPKDFWKWVEEE